MTRTLLSICTMMVLWFVFATSASAMTNQGGSWCKTICGLTVGDDTWTAEQSFDMITSATVANPAYPPGPPTITTQCTTKVYYQTNSCVQGINRLTFVRITRIERTCSPAGLNYNPFDEIKKAIQKFILDKDDPLDLVETGPQYMYVRYPSCLGLVKCSVPPYKHVTAPCGTTCCEQSYQKITTYCGDQWHSLGNRSSGPCDNSENPPLPVSLCGEGDTHEEITNTCSSACQEIKPLNDHD